VETEIKVAVDAGYNWISRNHEGSSKSHQKTPLHQELMDLQVLPCTKYGSPGRCFIEKVECIVIKPFLMLGYPVVARIFAYPMRE